MTGPAPGPAPPPTTRLSAVEQELAALGRAAGAGAGFDPAATQSVARVVVRARMSNLLVLCRSEAEASRAMADLPEILAIHPARALVLVAEAGTGATGLEAHVAAHRHVRDGSQVCGESVTITARGRAVDRLPAAARALLLGDLPSTLWWATTRLPEPEDALFAELREMVSLVVLDSRDWRDAAGGLAALGVLDGRSPTPALADVGWRRLRLWRRLLAQGADPGEAPGFLGAVAEVAVTHGGDAAGEGRLVLGWLAGRLGWRFDAGPAPGETGTWRFTAGGRTIRAVARPAARGGLRRVEVRTAAAPGGEGVVVEAPDEHRLTLTGPGGHRVVARPAESRATLLARLLSEREPDPLFREALAAAAPLASRSA